MTDRRGQQPLLGQSHAQPFISPMPLNEWIRLLVQRRPKRVRCAGHLAVTPVPQRHRRAASGWLLAARSISIFRPAPSRPHILSMARRRRATLCRGFALDPLANDLADRNSATRSRRSPLLSLARNFPASRRAAGAHDLDGCREARQLVRLRTSRSQRRHRCLDDVGVLDRQPSLVDRSARPAVELEPAPPRRSPCGRLTWRSLAGSPRRRCDRCSRRPWCSRQ